MITRRLKWPVNVAGLICLLAIEASGQVPTTQPAWVEIPAGGIADHADATQINSLAWYVARSAREPGRPAGFRLKGPGVFYLRSSLVIPGHVSLAIGPGVTLKLGDRVRLTVEKDIEIQSETCLTGSFGSVIESRLRGNPHDYYGIVKTSKTTPVKNLRIERLKFVNTEAVGLYALAVNAGGGENVQVRDCETEGCGLVFAMNVKRITVRDNQCRSSTLEKLNIFDNHHDGIYLGGSDVEDVLIKNNRILDRRCHGIAVVMEDIYSEPTKNPERAMQGRRILVEGNTVINPDPRGGSAGGIWFSCVQDCRVIGNHVENYGDVGIDFEGSRNGLADSNVLIDNNKNLALYGNCRNITFSNNTVTMTRPGDKPENQSCAFMNTYSNGYPGHTDLRNSDIFVTGNLFSVSSKVPVKGWTGGIVAGTARRIHFNNNVFVNCHFESHFCHDLETIEIENNSFFNDGNVVESIPLLLAVAENNPKTRQPTKHFLIRNNRFRLVNDAKIPSAVEIATQAVIHGKPTEPFCDLNATIENNVIERQTTTQPAVTFTDNYRGGHRKDMAVRCIVRNNVTNAKVVLNIPPEQRTSVKSVVSGNVGMGD